MRPKRFGHHGEATWWVADGLLFVRAPAYGQTCTQVGTAPPEGLARMLLSDLVRGLHETGPVEGLTRGDGTA